MIYRLFFNYFLKCFYEVYFLGRFKDLDLDIFVIVKVNLLLGFNVYYNCSVDVNFCEVWFYGNYLKLKGFEVVGVFFLYGLLDIEL